MKLRASLTVFAIVGIVGIAGCGGGDSVEEVNAKSNRDLIARGCAPAFGDGSLREAINDLSDGIADNPTDPIRDKAGEFCPGGAEKEARLAARATAKAQTAQQQAEDAEFAAKRMEKERVAELWVAMNELMAAREGLALTVEDYRGSLPDAESAYASTRQGFRDRLAGAEAVFKKWNEPLPPE